MLVIHTTHVRRGHHRRPSLPIRSPTGPARQARARKHRPPPRHYPRPARLRAPPRANARAPSGRTRLLGHRAVLRHRTRCHDPGSALSRPPPRHGVGTGAARARSAGARPRHQQAPRTGTPRSAAGRRSASGCDSRITAAASPSGPKPRPGRGARSCQPANRGAVRGGNPPPPDRPGARRYLRRPRHLAQPVPGEFLVRNNLRDHVVSRQPAQTHEGVPPSRDPFLRHGGGPQSRPRLAGTHPRRHPPQPGLLHRGAAGHAIPLPDVPRRQATVAQPP